MSRSKRGSVQKLARGRYRVWYYVGDKRRSKVYRGDEAGAYALLDRLSANDDAADAAPASQPQLTVETYYTEQYHPWIKATKAPRTVEGYESQWKLARPLFGGEDMHTLKASAIEARIQTLETPGQQLAVYKIMRQIFGRAYRRDVIEHNPMSKTIERKRMPYYQREVYTAEELTKVLLTAIEYNYEYLFAILLCSLGGLRRSEALGLVWGDIKHVEGASAVLVHVGRTWQRQLGQIGSQDVKTQRSVRNVAISGTAGRILARASVDKPADAGVVAEPRPNPDTVTRSWKAFCYTHDLRYVSLQGLRATYSTLLADAGASDAVVSDSLGHAVLSTRYRHYMTRADDARIDLAHRLDDILPSTD